jgi:hypothetical protein
LRGVARIDVFGHVSYQSPKTRRKAILATCQANHARRIQWLILSIRCT